MQEVLYRMNLEDLDTPNVVINEAIVEQNIQRVQSFFDGLGIAFRPHIKTHKSIEIAKKQLKAGAKGINCQKLSEAEVFAKAGFKDILLSYNVVGEKKLKFLRDLTNICSFKVTADHKEVVKNLSLAFAKQKKNAASVSRMRYWRLPLWCAKPARRRMEIVS